MFGGKGWWQAAAGERGAFAANTLVDTGLAGELAAAAFEEYRRHRGESGQEGIPESITHEIAPAGVARLYGLLHDDRQKANYSGCSRVPCPASPGDFYHVKLVRRDLGGSLGIGKNWASLGPER